MKESIEQDLEVLIDKSNRLIEALNQKINHTFNASIKRLEQETEKKVQALNNLQQKAENRCYGYYNRKKMIDYLVYINLAVTPILFFIIVYIQFFKK